MTPNNDERYTMKPASTIVAAASVIDRHAETPIAASEFVEGDNT